MCVGGGAANSLNAAAGTGLANLSQNVSKAGETLKKTVQDPSAQAAGATRSYESGLESLSDSYHSGLESLSSSFQSAGDFLQDPFGADDGDTPPGTTPYTGVPGAGRRSGRLGKGRKTKTILGGSTSGKTTQKSLLG